MGVRQDTFIDYDGFLDKFKPKKTTDDCYTPPNVYEAVKAWAVKEYGLEGREVVRPFWPGGDYMACDYPAGCVVIDNPPFSIIGKIVRWYYAQEIDYFLFAPYLTNLGIGAGEAGVNHIIAPCDVLYENGAAVGTAFVTNMGDAFIRSAPDLMDAIEAANDENLKASRQTLPKYVYPPELLTSAAVGYMCKHHTPFAVTRGDCAFVRKLDAQGDKGIFGAGCLLSERAAAERAAAVVWQLSARERGIIRLLGGGVA